MKPERLFGSQSVSEMRLYTKSGVDKRRPVVSYLIFAYDQLAQFQLVAGDMSVMTERARLGVVSLAERAARMPSTTTLPVGLYTPLGRTCCFALSIPLAQRESFSGRSGLRAVVVIYLEDSRAPATGELLTKIRLLESHFCSAVGLSATDTLGNAAQELGRRLQEGWTQSARERFVEWIGAATSLASWTHGAPVTRWAYPTDVVCGKTAAVLSEGVRSANQCQLSLYLPHGAQPPTVLGPVTACWYEPNGVYVSTHLEDKEMRKQKREFGIWRSRLIE